MCDVRGKDKAGCIKYRAVGPEQQKPDRVDKMQDQGTGQYHEENEAPNGYRSLHLILEVPIFLTNEKKMMRVEVQFRTIAMDFWASLEHKLKYKKDIDNAQVISQDLCFCAELISQLDGRMQQIRERLEEKKDDTQSNITGV